jgi:hypothetical protein
MDMILSIDLSGPSSTERTGMAWFEAEADNLEFVHSQIGATDSDIATLAEDLAASGRTAGRNRCSPLIRARRRQPCL